MSAPYAALDAALLATLREGARPVRELIDVHKPPADHPRRRAYEQPQPSPAAGGEG
ncbi:MAG TPA: hypothetical protein VF457_15735 [Burkholderiaceae bacterium]